MPESPSGALLGVDAPATPVLSGGLIQFSGWIAAPDLRPEDLSFALSGHPVKEVRFFARSDVHEHVSPLQALGWGFWFYIESKHVGRGGALILEAFHAGVAIGARLFRYVYAGGDGRPLTIFMHLMKTGGTAVRDELEKHKDALKMLPVYDADTLGMPLSQLSTTPERAFENFDLIYGHFPFGFFNVRERPFIYLTVIRNPYDYILSQFYFMKMHTRDVRVAEFRNPIEAMEAGKGFLSNNFCRVLTHSGDDVAMTEQSFKAAKDVLDTNFEFVGLAENMEYTMRVISRFLGINATPYLPIVNATPLSQERSNLDLVSFRREAAKHNTYDLELYEYVQARFWGAGMRPLGAV